MKKNKKIAISLVLLSLVLIPIICYKMAVCEKYINMTIYDTKALEGIKELRKGETITINHKDYNGEFLRFKDISVPDTRGDFLLNEKESWTVSYLAPEKSLVVIMEQNSLSEMLEDGYLYDSEVIEAIENLKTKNNIKNEIDLMKYLKTYQFHDIKIYTSTKTIVKDYVMSMVAYRYSFVKNVIYINGDYNGIMYKIRDGYEAIIEKNDKSYLIDWRGPTKQPISKEEMCDLISGIIIE